MPRDASGRVLSDHLCILSKLLIFKLFESIRRVISLLDAIVVLFIFLSADDNIVKVDVIV